MTNSKAGASSPSSGASEATVRELLDRLENYYDFECTGGPLRNCVEWQRLKALVAPAAPPPQPSWRDAAERLRQLAYEIGVTASALSDQLRVGTPAADDREAAIRMLESWRGVVFRIRDALLAASPSPQEPE